MTVTLGHLIIAILFIALNIHVYAYRCEKDMKYSEPTIHFATRLILIASWVIIIVALIISSFYIQIYP